MDRSLLVFLIVMIIGIILLIIGIALKVTRAKTSSGMSKISDALMIVGSVTMGGSILIYTAVTIRKSMNSSHTPTMIPGVVASLQPAAIGVPASYAPPMSYVPAPVVMTSMASNKW